MDDCNFSLKKSLYIKNCVAQYDPPKEAITVTTSLK